MANTNAFKIKNGLDLGAYNKTISDTAVDVFVYDTSQDSDGGAWRKSTQGTSWYNETLNTSTRGSRKEFPSVAVIVAENGTITIYDGDDPDLPMWMVFNAPSTTPYSIVANISANLTSVTALNGVVCFGNGANYGLGYINFVSEVAFPQWRENAHSIYLGNIAERNDQKGVSTYDTNYIVDEKANDVAMTVLPNAPIDAATGLPAVTIACATDGGVSVIKDDGTVVDITVNNASYTFSHTVDFLEDNSLGLSIGTSSGAAGDSYYIFHTIPTADNVITVDNITGTTQDVDEFYSVQKSGSIVDLRIDGSDSARTLTAVSKNAYGTSYGVSVVDRNKSAADKGMIAYMSADYNTGWQNGAIKLATLSDTDDTNVTGAELVTNGTFDTDTSGWTDYTSNYMTLSHASNAARLTYASNFSAWYGIGQDITTVVGKTYVASYEVTESDSGMEGSYFYLGDSTILYGVSGSPEKSGTITGTFVATSTTTNIRTGHGGAGVGSGDYYTVDNFTVRLAEEDRSVNGNGLQVFGTVTKTPVATGADLVAYSGFSASNYLEQPYNSDLDFGTGDFCYMGWFKTSSNGITMFERCASPRSGNGMTVYMDGTGKPLWYKIVSGVPTIVVVPTSAYNNNSWVHLAAIRQNGVVSLYFNGQKDGSASDSTDMTNTSAIFRLGANATGTSGWTGSLALFRISATAPSPEQIARIYNDEKHLFTEGAQATLYGSSDAVTALAYDDSTNILSVGTSAGRSDFQGLRRVNNTTNAVGVAISASNGMIVEE